MTMQEAVRSVLSKYATFEGRAARSEVWWWFLAIIIASIVAGLIDGLLFPNMQLLSLLLGLAIIVPNLAVGARRLHDIDRTGWWLLMCLLPIIGTLVLLWFFIQKGTDGANRFG
jgi:uncharacterized membrane protein YhaH (DUF805 family)